VGLTLPARIRQTDLLCEHFVTRDFCLVDLRMVSDEVFENSPTITTLNPAMKKLLTFLAAATACLSATTPSNLSAQALASADFSSYSDGELVGQNGWQQYQSQTTLPLTVSNGVVSWSGGATVNNQDAMLAFPEQITQPLSGTNVLTLDLFLRVTAPSTGSSPSYFLALNTLTTTVTSGNFQNARLVALATNTGFVFGARVNGQNGYPFFYGTEELTIGQDYALRAEINMVAGNANDSVNLLVGPDFNNLSPYATAGYTTGTVSDPLFGAVLISQFGSASVSEAGVSIASVSVVPEPGTYALLGLAAAGLAGYVVRRRRR